MSKRGRDGQDEGEPPRDRRDRGRPPLRELKLELIGVFGDAAHAERTAALTEWRNRFIPLLRGFITTHSTVAIPEQSQSREPALRAGSVSVPLTGGRGSIDRFMRWDFFSLKLSRPNLVVRPYFDEPLRRVSYLVFDSLTKNAVLVDPTALHHSEYLEDLRARTLTLTGVCRTHVPFDARMLTAADLGLEAHALHQHRLALATGLEVVFHATPGYQDGSGCWLLNEGSSTLLCFTGPSLGTDCIARCDISADGARRVPAAEQKVRASSLHGALRGLVHFFVEDTIILPSHGGYSHATAGLDLHWGCHWADFKRNTANAALLQAMQAASPTAFACYEAQQSKQLPLPWHFAGCKSLNDADETAVLHESQIAVLDPTELHQRLAASEYSCGITDLSSRLLVDLRPLEDFTAKQLAGSVNIPLSFPTDVRSAKKGELWLGTLLHPQQRHTFLCPDGEVRRCALRVFRMGLPLSQCDFIDSRHVPTASWSAAPWRRARTPQDLARLTRDVVLDCRTPCEYRNGSHIQCIHLPLAELRRAVLRETPVDLQQTYDAALHAAATNSLMVYCAAGYRSHIAVTLVRAVLQGGTIDSTDSSGGQGVDVVGGALAIMTRRPDLWTVKDRSIICIS